LSICFEFWLFVFVLGQVGLWSWFYLLCVILYIVFLGLVWSFRLFMSWVIGLCL